MRIRAQGEAVGQVGALAVEAGALGGDGNAVGQWQRVGVAARAGRLGGRLQSGLRLEDRPGEGRRVPAVEEEGVEAVQREMIDEPLGAPLL